MDPISFGIVKREVQRLPFKDDKVNAIAFAQGLFYAEQVAELMREFSYDDGRLKGLQACIGKMLPATCVGIIPLLRAFSFDNNKVSALELVAAQVTDPLNFVVFNEVFPYINERNRVGIIMQRRSTMGPPQTPIMVNPGVAGNPYPYGRPKPSVDPNDPLYRVADKAVTGAVNVVEGACGMLFGRPQQRGVVVQRPAVVTYQTTSYVTPPGAGQQVLHVPPGATVTTVTPPASYPQQAYPVGTYPMAQPPAYHPQGGYSAQPQWK